MPVKSSSYKRIKRRRQSRASSKERSKRRRSGSVRPKAGSMRRRSKSSRKRTKRTKRMHGGGNMGIADQSCPYCLRRFHTENLIVRHIIMKHKDEYLSKGREGVLADIRNESIKKVYHTPIRKKAGHKAHLTVQRKKAQESALTLSNASQGK